jgi:hypothetical protein
VSADPPPVAFKGEVMLAGWQETHNGGAKVTFWLPSPEELEPFRMATVRKGKTAGQRYMCVLVEIDDQEQPVHHPSSSAHLMITGPQFLEYAKAVGPNRGHWDSARAREWAKYLMGVESLAQIDTDPQALLRYERLVRIPFAEWNGKREGNHGEDDDRDSGGVDADPGEPSGV